GEKHLVAPERGLGLRALDGDARDVSRVRDQILVMRARNAGRTMVDAQGAENVPLPRADRRGPDRSQPVLQDMRLIGGPRPSRSRSAVPGDHLNLLGRRDPAGARVGTDGKPRDRRGVAARQGGRDAVFDYRAAPIDQVDAADTVTAALLEQPA